ncbi:MAG: DUF2911 domain-containing protein [Chitinophagaceae bacterium]|jgi:hypothetical protein|nr:DUF2911 domain-containing protein [Chitinophagaceae bacterium]
MKKLLFLAIAAISIGTAFAQERKRASPRETVENENVKVTYGRPYKKGRVIFGQLEKFGSVWRLGADEATEITFKKDGTFAGQPVKAGTYTMFALINEKEWEIILNSELKQWGAYGYEKIKDKNVLQAKVPVGKTPSVVEQLTIDTGGDGLTISWDDTMVKVPYKF